MRGKMHLYAKDSRHLNPLFGLSRRGAAARPPECSWKPVSLPRRELRAPGFPGPIPEASHLCLLCLASKRRGLPGNPSFPRFSSYSYGHTLVRCCLLPASPGPSKLPSAALGSPGRPPVSCSTPSTPCSMIPITSLLK